MIESIVGISLVTIGILGIIVLLTNSSVFYNTAVNNLRATYLAAEGIEVVKNIVDANYVENDNQWTPPANGWYYVDYGSGTSGSGNSFTSIANLPSPPIPQNASFVKFDSSNNVYVGPDSPIGENTIFRRIVNIQNKDNYLKVLSYVSWNEGASPKQVLLEDHFYRWRP